MTTKIGQLENVPRKDVIQASYEQFTDFNGLFGVFLLKKLLLCIRETLRKPNAIKACFE